MADIQAEIGLQKAKQLMGCTDDSCMAQIAGALGVDLLVNGSLARVGKSLILEANLIDAVKCTVVRRFSDRIQNGDDESFFDATDRASATLFPDASNTATALAVAKADRRSPRCGAQFDGPQSARCPNDASASRAGYLRAGGLRVGVSELTAAGGWGMAEVGWRFNDWLSAGAFGLFAASKHGGAGAEVTVVPLFRDLMVHPIVGLGVPVLFASSVLIAAEPGVGVEVAPIPSWLSSWRSRGCSCSTEPRRNREAYLMGQLTAKVRF